MMTTPKIPGPRRLNSSSFSKKFGHALPLKPNNSGKPINVLYEDDQFIVFDKPAGLLVIPTPKNEQRTLVSIVNQQCAGSGRSWKLHPCHRIDRETSGVVIFAKGKRAQQAMMDIFKERRIEKKYTAFVHGQLPAKSGEFRKPIKKNRTTLAALTKYRVLETKKQFSVVEVRPVTGRTNQIRIHFAQAGHPLLGERKFAFGRDYHLKFRRVALHAAGLEWTHPVSKKKVNVQAKLSKDMADFLARY